MNRRVTHAESLLLAALAACVGCAGEADLQVQRDSLAIRPVATTSSPTAPHRVTGLGSCASSGCHGETLQADQFGWPSAYAHWLRDDPHRSAFEVLYTERSVEIYRNLHPETKLAAELPQDADYFQFLEQRCIGCHATGLPGRELTASPGAAKSPDEYLAGVHCESCHGAASGWIGDHVRTTWPAAGHPDRPSLADRGFRDTADLRTRAGVCLACHMGPQVGGNVLYDVNHDLIAAGHPRLAFELDAYLENYPPHWDAPADQQRHRDVFGGSYHVDAWRFGQEQAARQMLRLWSLRLAEREQAGAPPQLDFASYECFDCHHALGSTARSGAAARDGLPRLNLDPLVNVMHWGPRDPGSRVWPPLPRWPGPSREEIGQWFSAVEEAPLAPCPASEMPDHAARLIAQLERTRKADFTFDQAVQCYLAAAALAAQCAEDDRQPALKQALDQLQLALSEPANFALTDRAVTQYDSPAAFSRVKIAPLLVDVRSALAPFANPSPRATTP